MNMTNRQKSELIWAGVFLFFAVFLYINRNPINLNSVQLPPNHPKIDHQLENTPVDLNNIYGYVDGKPLMGTEVKKVLDIINIIEPDAQSALASAIEKALEFKLLKLEAEKLNIKILKKDIDELYTSLAKDMQSSENQENREILNFMIEINLLKSRLSELKQIDETQFKEWLSSQMKSKRVKRI